LQKKRPGKNHVFTWSLLKPDRKAEPFRVAAQSRLFYCFLPD
jgi:hypothetical protein